MALEVEVQYFSKQRRMRRKGRQPSSMSRKIGAQESRWLEKNARRKKESNSMCMESRGPNRNMGGERWEEEMK